MNTVLVCIESCRYSEPSRGRPVLNDWPFVVLSQYIRSIIGRTAHEHVVCQLG